MFWAPIAKVIKTGEATELLELYREQTEIISQIPFVQVCRDPKDDIVIATAMAANARFVITGDKDLIALRQHEGVRFLTAQEFLGLGDG